MKDLLEICCGIDVHKDVLVACLLKGSIDKEPIPTIRELSTLLSGLTELQEWLLMENCYDIAMESTGVYWYTLYNVLEAGFTGRDVHIIVTNPRHMKNVPGKKTDTKDAQWIATLLRAGLLKPSYIPPADIRELRDLTRYRRNMVHETAIQKNRVEKYLQQCGFKLSSILSDIFGMSGSAIIDRLCIKGKIEATEVLGLLRGTARAKYSQVQQAVNGTMSEHQRSFLAMLVKWYRDCEAHVQEVETRMYACAEKYREAIDLVCTIPAVQEITAITVISEIGVNLRAFPSAAHLCSWAGMCPGNNESAGKRKSEKVLHANAYIKSILCQCAWGTARSRHTYLHEWFWKLKVRRGGKRAVMAVAHKLLSFIYHILTNHQPFDEERHLAVKEEQDKIRIHKIIAEAKNMV